MSNEEMEFDISGIEAPIANALRRIMISEVRIKIINEIQYNKTLFF